MCGHDFSDCFNPFFGQPCTFTQKQGELDDENWFIIANAMHAFQFLQRTSFVSVFYFVSVVFLFFYFRLLSTCILALVGVLSMLCAKLMARHIYAIHDPFIIITQLTKEWLSVIISCRMDNSDSGKNDDTNIGLPAENVDVIVSTVFG